jgi:hypothetical protein
VAAMHSLQPPLAHRCAASKGRPAPHAATTTALLLPARSLNRNSIGPFCPPAH